MNFEILEPLREKRDLIDEEIGTFTEKVGSLIAEIEDWEDVEGEYARNKAIDKLGELRTLVNNLESDGEIGIGDEYSDLEGHIETLYVANEEKNNYVTTGRFEAVVNFEAALNEVLEWSNDEN